MNFDVGDAKMTNFDDVGNWLLDNTVRVSYLGTISDPLDGQASIIVYDPKAPEPSTWLLMMSGGGLCLRLRRRVRL